MRQVSVSHEEGNQQEVILFRKKGMVSDYVSYQSVELKRYRLRNKMHLESEENLVEFILSI